MNQEKDKDPQLQALISLLDEPDFSTFNQVRNRIFTYGASAVPMLEDAWENTFDSLIQNRIEDIIHSIQYNQLYLDLTNWDISGTIICLRATYCLPATCIRILMPKNLKTRSLPSDATSGWN